MATFAPTLPVSLSEAVQQAVLLALIGGDTLAGQRIERGRRDAFSMDDLTPGPAISLLRGDGALEPFGQDADRSDASFALYLWAQGRDWETTVDALHLQCHRVLLADPTLARLGRGLRCTDTSPQDRPGDVPIGRLKVQYRLAAIVRRDTLAPLSPP